MQARSAAPSRWQRPWRPRAALPCAHRTEKRCHRGAAPRASPSDSEFEGVAAGDEDVQRALEDQLRLQLKSEAIKESIKEDLRSKVEDLKQISEELQAKLDEGYRIEKFRNDLESQEALASAMEKFNELEDEIAAMKQQLQADREDLAAWERASAAARSKGLFFKNLYTPEPDAAAEGGEGRQPGGAGAAQRQGGQAAAAGSGRRFGGEIRGSLDPAAAEAARRVAAKVEAPAHEEVGSPLRLWLFAYMAAILALVVGQDLTTAAPSLGLDALYGVLGLVLGVNAWNERQVLASRRQDGGMNTTSSGGGGGGGGQQQRPPAAEGRQE